ncbi:MAG TPA: FKBP-type peptidyl-prolyl cis-trans isomerase [Solirubrobacterales bacterium]
MRKLLLIIGACLALLVVAGCGSDDSTTSSSTPESTEEASAPEETESTAKKTKPKVTVPNGAPPKQLVVKDLEEGTGAAVKNGDVVQVNYVGVNFKTGKEFDSSWSRGEPIAFPVGENVVIQGWEKGLLGMKVGGRRELIIPPDLGYGAAGSPPTIPPNETLVFVLDLEAIE